MRKTAVLKKWTAVLAAFVMIGCTSASSEPGSTGKQGCDAFEDCDSAETDNRSDGALTLKESYEALNGTQNASGKTHRTVSVPEDHPFVTIQAAEAVEAIKEGESFYLYFGDPKCPWCRAVLEEAIKAAAENNVAEIRYVEIWDEAGNELLRDRYELVNGSPVKTGEGSAEYTELLKLLDPVLAPYELQDQNGNLTEVGEKRIYAPNYIYIENGTAVRLVTGIPSELADPRSELSKELLSEEHRIFTEFFAGP